MEIKIKILEIFEGVRSGNRRFVSKAITFVESIRPEDQKKIYKFLSKLSAGQTCGQTCLRIGITGAPGVGKSTFIEAIGLLGLQQGHKIAVLAVDPSSPAIGGAILADKTRMKELSRHPTVYIRPSSSGKNVLGGIRPSTADSLLILEAAGFNLIFVETVGVGQNEVGINDLVDIVILLLSPVAGDELQGIKKGVVELADLIVVNKVDGNLIPYAQQTRQSYQGAGLGGQEPFICSALTGEGIEKVWQDSHRLFEKLKTTGMLFDKRGHQREKRMMSFLEQRLMALFLSNPEVVTLHDSLLKQVREGTLSPYEAGEELLSVFFKRG